ncbi:hypothetical protein A2477_03855 [Candidatus Falkowbacteria bacterium RIFOXYC2_FULL_47_12]|uniref:Acylneuraminate cytidylyltransferase family protein n=2 Tax=Candidatus Falkowiibacteriota TaxID=1752728 RepID=A0A1F5TP06_9BACT|nr:MAG: hypothetical protein A2242_04460 [Candidatus Falkowbacteria bacterium RIFOXYA2_FULL_47_9]OGF40610.1 MAG: hypothetical protein A2477_03855 [Candidatus Falkowbacteria bacterium RIFOXYC2_FULL_47_12]
MTLKSAALLIAKQHSSRLKNKNFRDFCGNPMFMWNVEKCLQLFDRVYVSSDYDYILEESEKLGARGIKRPPELCESNVPNIPVYQHALPYMDNPEIIVTVKVDSPTIKKEIIKQAKELMEHHDYNELMTVFPAHADANRVYGAVWALRRERLKNYKDFWNPQPDVLLVDDSIDIHTEADLIQAEKQMRNRVI